MTDPYLYKDCKILKNKLDIKDSETLDLIEAEQSRMNMMLLYEQGFNDFSPKGLQYIHQFLFGDIYEWAGNLRIINIQKREELLGGKSVWYSNEDDIENDLIKAFTEINNASWESLSKEMFVSNLVRTFSAIWQIHPFREGNTRTVVMLITFFVENSGYYFDKELLAQSAGYVRNSFVMASLDHLSEFEHMERILLDAISETPILYNTDDLGVTPPKYTQYQQKPYKPQEHEYIPD